MVKTISNIEKVQKIGMLGQKVDKIRLKVFFEQSLTRELSYGNISSTKKMQKRIPSYLVGGEEGADACIESQHKQSA